MKFLFPLRILGLLKLQKLDELIGYMYTAFNTCIYNGVVRTLKRCATHIKGRLASKESSQTNLPFSLGWSVVVIFPGYIHLFRNIRIKATFATNLEVY